MLNPEQIAAMTAGRETDAAVAEFVMGLRLFTATKKQTAISGGCRVAQATWVDTGEVHEWGPVVERIASYSSDIGAAWLVVKHLCPQTDNPDGLILTGATFELGAPHPIFSSSQSRFWVARFYQSACYGETAPLAICKASLACRAALAMQKGEGDGEK